MKYTERKTCRISGEPLIELFSLGNHYVSNFVPIDYKENPEDRVPLTLCLAPKSRLVQLKHTVEPDSIYRKYWYHSGVNNTMKRELENIVESIYNLNILNRRDIWIDIGANDGSLLSNVRSEYITIAIEPADCQEQLKQTANYIVNDYFTKELIQEILGRRKAKIITSIAMFYDLDNPKKFVSDIYDVLAEDGLWIIQMNYLPLMLQQLDFGGIVHEHLEYYSLSALKYLLNKHGFTIMDCLLNNTNGGSFRIYIQKSSYKHANFGIQSFKDVATFRVQSILNYEDSLALTEISTYNIFFKQIQELKSQITEFIKQEKNKGRSIIGYGSSTKGNTILQFFELDNTLIDAITDRQEIKWGLKTISTNIPIISDEEMRKIKPDYLLILPWQFIAEFKEREKEYLKNGGKFIVPCPKFEIIGDN